MRDIRENDYDPGLIKATDTPGVAKDITNNPNANPTKDDAQPFARPTDPISQPVQSYTILYWAQA